jgi:nucleotide-binding universal stress UspA family protein
MAVRKILVPIDGTGFSYRIFPSLIQLMDSHSSEIILLTVREPVSGRIASPPRPVTDDGMVQSYENAPDFNYAAHPIYASQERDSALADFRSAAQPHVDSLAKAGFKISYDIRFGNIVDELVSYVESNSVDLIAMATHWRTGLDRLLKGSTLTKVLPKVGAPLLIIRSEEE